MLFTTLAAGMQEGMQTDLILVLGFTTISGWESVTRERVCVNWKILHQPRGMEPAEGRGWGKIRGGG